MAMSTAFIQKPILMTWSALPNLSCLCAASPFKKTPSPFRLSLRQK
jgi:hypothetical protein